MANHLYKLESFVDVHIIVKPTDSQEWLKQCLESLESEPVKIHVIDAEIGLPKGLIASRLKGFACGSSPFISFVDPDDYCIPGLFHTLISVMQRNDRMAAAFAHEYITGVHGDVKKGRVNSEPHHAIVYRRSEYEKAKTALESWVFPSSESETVAVLRRLDAAKVIEINEPLYVWRRHYNATLVQEHKKRIYGESKWLGN